MKPSILLFGIAKGQVLKTSLLLAMASGEEAESGPKDPGQEQAGKVNNISDNDEKMSILAAWKWLIFKLTDALALILTQIKTLYDNL